MSDSNFKEVARTLAGRMEREPRILAAYLHGSFGTPTFRSDSDVDCAILPYPGRGLDAVETMRLAGELGGELGVSLDMGMLNGRNLVYFVHAVAGGTRIFCRDSALTDSLVALAFSLYAKLKEDRAEIEGVYHAI